MATVTYQTTTTLSPFVVNTWTGGDQYRPAITSLTNGGFAVSYLSMNGSEGYQLLNFYGSSGVTPGYVTPYSNDGTDAFGTAAAITRLTNGNVVVIWTDEHPTTPGLAATIFGPAGAWNVRTDFNLTTYSSDRFPQVTALAGGGFAVANVNGNEIWLEIFNSLGGSVSGEVWLNTQDPDCAAPTITQLANGNIVVAWQRFRNDGVELRGAILDPSGNVVRSDFNLAEGGSKTAPSIVALPDGGFAMVYLDTRWTSPDTDITVSYFDDNGGLIRTVWANSFAGNGGNEADPSIAVLPNGFLLVTYTDLGGDQDVRLIMLDTAGSVVQINGLDSLRLDTDGLAGFSAVTSLVGNAGRFAVVWEDTFTDGSGGSIRGATGEIYRRTVGDATDETLTGDALRDVMEGMGGNDVLIGGAGADVLNGGDDSDILIGGSGDDTMNGGDGDDVYYVADLYDTTIESSATGGTDTVYFSYVSSTLAWFLDPNFENLVLTGAAWAGFGNELANSITGNDVANLLRGLVGDDTIRGGGGADTLEGNEGADTIFGDEGNDIIDGGADSDMIDGGAGVDQLRYLSSDQAVSIDLSADTASGGHAAGDSITGIENLIGSAFDDTLVGSSAANSLNGANGADTLLGLGGNDTLEGSGGNDTLDGGADDDTLIGGLGVDAISGGAGNDTFVYAIGDGNGTMNGGADTDTLNVSDGAAGAILNASYDGTALTVLSGNSLTSIETITANLGAGADWLVYASASAAVSVNLATGAASGFSSIANIERVVGGGGNDTLTGNGLDNRLDGGAGADTLSGGGGIDTLIGGDGADALSGGLSNDSIQGGAGNDTINWAVTDGRDTVDGGADFDTFNAAGSASAELGRATWNGTSLTAVMDNGLGNIEAVNLDLGGGVDWLIYAAASAAVSVNLATGAASGFASIANIEKVIGASGNDTLTGDGLDNRLDGQGGADTLDGGAGVDTVLGGDGDDVIYASAGNDSLQGQNGADTFIWTAADGRDAFNGGADIDTVNLTGSAAADVADANWNGSAITGLLNNALIDIELVNLDLGAGGAGGDWLRYNTTFGVSVNLATGAATGFASITGVENLIGGSGADALTGDAGANKINGANGDDIITGGAGNDNLTGGAGSDAFVYAAGCGNDTIIDFDAWAVGGQDFIDVSGFGINAANFSARVAIIDVGADTVIRIDNTYFITLKNVTGDGDNSISQADFILGA